MNSIVRQIRDLCSSDVSESALFERAADVIYGANERFNWVGMYRVDHDELVLVGWRGPSPTKHVRIPLSQGICGFAATNTETVVESVVAEIDIDSDTVSAFSREDRATLEEAAVLMGAKISELRS